MMLLLSSNACTESMDPPQDAGSIEDVTPMDVASGDVTPQDAGVAPRVMVVVSSGEAAAQAGLEVLDEGGDAMDAALTIAFDQIVHTGGSWNSFAGILGLLYYEAETGDVHGLHASYRTFAGEEDPLSIPSDAPSGRTALVPGFMRGAEAAHARFGTLPWARLFSPAIQDAEQGVPVGRILAGEFQRRSEVLTRLPTTREVFAPDGTLPRQGDRFRQPRLAETLRAVADQGADYMYTGSWAEAFVDAVNAEEGAARLEDLAGYAPVWTESPCISRGEDSVCLYGAPDLGGLAVGQSLLVLEAAGIPDAGPYSEDADAFYWMVRALQIGQLMAYTPGLLPTDPDLLAEQLDGVSAEPNGMLDAAQAARLVAHTESGAFDRAVLTWSRAYGEFTGPDSHSDAVVVVDADGDVVVMTHTINTVSWGQTGINVAGVSVPDSASFQQGLLALVGPAAHVPSPLNPTVVLRDGQARLAATTIGNVHYAMVPRLASVLYFDHDPAGALALPPISGSAYAEIVEPDAFPSALLTTAAARGVRVTEAADSNPGYWFATALDAQGAPTSGAFTPTLSVLGGGVYPERED